MAATADIGPASRAVRMAPAGAWHGPVRLRRGWARAEARPWNDAHDDAYLRVLRGGAGFIAGCARVLLEAGAPSVFSPPLAAPAAGTWSRAGFSHYLDLALLRLELALPPPTPDHPVTKASIDELDEVVAVDAAAFDDFWRLNEAGLREAIAATASAELLTVGASPTQTAGFAIVGYGHALSYLQRVAVSASFQRRGLGRSLVRAAAARARIRGARAMLLNTQTDNDAALRLYAEEGFVTLPDELVLLQAESPAR